MIRRILVMGMVMAVILTAAVTFSGHFLCPAEAGDEAGQIDRVQKLEPQIISDIEQETISSGESVPSKIRQKTGKEEVIVEINKLTGAPHRIIRRRT